MILKRATKKQLFVVHQRSKIDDLDSMPSSTELVLDHLHATETNSNSSRPRIQAHLARRASDPVYCFVTDTWRMHDKAMNFIQ